MKKTTGSLLGVVIGFAIGQVAGVVTGYLRAKAEGRSIRRLMSLEIDQNLRLLHDYWDEVSAPEQAPEASPSAAMLRATRWAQTPLPRLGDRIWSSHTDKLATLAVLDERQLRAAWAFYEHLTLLQALHGRLARAWEKTSGEGAAAAQAQAPVAGRPGAVGGAEPAAVALGLELEQMTADILNAGNPIGYLAAE